MEKSSPGLAVLLMGKGDADARTKQTAADSDMSDEELDEARKDAMMAHDEAHEAGDQDGKLDAMYALHKLHAEKMRREEGD